MVMERNVCVLVPQVRGHESPSLGGVSVCRRLCARRMGEGGVGMALEVLYCLVLASVFKHGLDGAVYDLRGLDKGCDDLYIGRLVSGVGRYGRVMDAGK